MNVIITRLKSKAFSLSLNRAKGPYTDIIFRSTEMNFESNEKLTHFAFQLLQFLALVIWPITDWVDIGNDMRNHIPTYTQTYT